MGTIDFKKTNKDIFMPSSKKAAIIELSNLPYLTLSGSGSPSSKVFEQSIEALYAVAYTIRMSYKSGFEIKDYYQYVVPPLEGIWSMQDGKEFTGTNKQDFKWELLIMLPEFADKEVCSRAIEIADMKKNNELIKKVSYKEISDGLCCTMLHVGSYDNEPDTFKRMEETCQESGFRRSSRDHREIYISDFRKTAEDKLKTVLRFKIAKI